MPLRLFPAPRSLPRAHAVPSEQDSPPSQPALQACLELRIADHAGPTFPLDPAHENLVGRAAEAVVTLADRLASRSHAIVAHDAASDGWILRDLGSRNGTWLDGRRVGSATLSDGAVVRIGTTELIFRLRPAVPPPRPQSSARVVRSGPIGGFQGDALRRSAATGGEEGRWPLLLYQAGMRLLAARSGQAVVGTTLELAAEHAGGSCLGWFRITGPERLEPVCVVPPGDRFADLITPDIRRLLAEDAQAVWLEAQGRELVCLPIVDRSQVHAMLAVAAPAGGLRAADFDFLVALASLSAAACAGRMAVDGRPGAVPDESQLALMPTEDLEDSAVGADAVADAAEGTLALDAATAAAIQAGGGDRSGTTPIGAAVAGVATLRIDDWQRSLVIEALRRTGGSVPNAAAELGISRATLYRKLEAWGLARPS